MKQPIRYGLSDADLGRIHPHPDGHLVMWADYAALKADVERLRSGSFTTAVPAEHYDRVVEAADAMRDCIDPDIFPNVIAAYNAAKEGRDAK